MNPRVQRLRRAVGRRVRAPAVDAGLLPYRPVGSPQSELSHYERGAYEYFADLDELPRYSVPVGYVRWITVEPAIADIGCGFGLLRQRLEGLSFSRYLGIDPVAEAIKRASALADERTSFVVADPITDVGSGELQRESFDICTLLDVLYVSSDPAALIDSARELLRPGGHLLSCNLRHPGDRGLARLLDKRLILVDAVHVQNLAPGKRRSRSWRITCHRRDG